MKIEKVSSNAWRIEETVEIEDRLLFNLVVLKLNGEYECNRDSLSVRIMKCCSDSQRDETEKAVEKAVAWITDFRDRSRPFLSVVDAELRDIWKQVDSLREDVAQHIEDYHCVR